MSQRGTDRVREWFGRGGRRRVLTVGVAATVVLAAAITVPLTLGAEATPCRQLPANAKALVADPAAATRALDPGHKLTRLPSAQRLLGGAKPCGDGVAVLGKIIQGATSGGPGTPHTRAQARSAYAVAVAFTADWEAKVPEGLELAVARMLAGYVVDTRYTEETYAEGMDSPVGTVKELRLSDGSGSRAGSFADPRDLHVLFGFSHDGRDPDVERLVKKVAHNPEAFAVLYDAERAYFAYYLERLDRRGTAPGKDRKLKTKLELRSAVERLSTLLRLREHYLQDGVITGLPAFEKAVHRHTVGSYSTRRARVSDTVLSGDIAARAAGPRPSVAALFDGRLQLSTVFEQWVKDRGISTGRAAELRVGIDEYYVRGQWTVDAMA